MKKKNIIKAEINEIVNGHTIEEINESKNWFLDKINKFDKLLARIMKERNTNHQNLVERGDINIDTVEIKRKIREYKEKFITVNTMT